MRTPPSPSLRFSTAATPPISTIFTRATKSTRNRSMPSGRLLRQPQGRCPRRRQECARPSWDRPGWPVPERSDLISALDGEWAETGKAIGDQGQGASAEPRRRLTSTADVERATRDSIRALMLIRAYRARGHFHANLDPLGLEPPNERRGTRSAHLRLHRRRSRPADLSRQGARASNSAPCARSSPSCAEPIARRSASSSCTSRTARRRAGSRSASRARTRRSPSPARASAPSSTSWSRPKASRNSAT